MALRSDLGTLYKNAKNQGEFIDSLHAVFQRYYAVGAIFLFNEKDLLMGSLYQSERVSREHYRQLLSQQKEMLEKRIKETSIITLSEKLKVVLYFKRDIPFDVVLKDFTNRKPEIKWAIIFYFFVIFVMATLFVVFSDRRKKTGKPQEKKEKPKIILSMASNSPANSGRAVSGMAVKAVTQAEAPKLVKNKSKPIFESTQEPIPESITQETDQSFPESESPFFSEKVLSLMESLEKKYGATSVRYYFWDTSKFRPVVQKQGGILIRGEAVEKLPDSFNKYVENPIIEVTQAGRQMAVPLVYRNALVGLLIVDSLHQMPITEVEKRQIADVCATFAQSIFLHRIYDAATVDADTDFYTYPYFYFYLQEKLKHKGTFLTFIFEIPDLNTITPQSLRVWAKDILFKLEEEKVKPELAVRIDRKKFVFIFDTSTHTAEGGLNLSSVERIPGLIERFSSESLQIKLPLHGGFFLRPQKIDSVDTFLKRLEFILIENRMNPDGVATLIEPEYSGRMENTGPGKHRIS
ncbi:MAG: hypothetical protein ABUK01_11610 [Leptospirales bacterium]